MELAVLGAIAVVLACSVAGGLATTWSLHRRTRRLEYGLADIEERLTTVRNRDKAHKRWEKADAMEDELQAVLTSARQQRPTGRTRQFVNDPMEPEL